ncbi:hypothetical protein MHSWG343_00160 [Candidatus Mycoplasma haematohominis]|uniref:Uncharacterized protein n=1 Tax=Candidatus Mycoplasma haematohominis TaxID=1494318 RepID=A0A478FP18_9MOLU|nr:hypothetical protein MHSWG343_00160 [Candidatus Mycoplasma haemohominis]
MSTLAKAATGSLIISSGIGVTAHQLSGKTAEPQEDTSVNEDLNNTNISETSTKIETPVLEEEREEKLEEASPSPDAVESKSTETKRDNSFFINNTFGWRTSVRTPKGKDPVVFKGLGGKKPDWIDTLVKPKGICATNDSKCEWSDFLRAKVPVGQKERLEQSARDHAYKKCREIGGGLSDSGTGYPKDWKTCTYYEGYNRETAEFYELNLDNPDLYEQVQK